MRRAKIPPFPWHQPCSSFRVSARSAGRSKRGISGTDGAFPTLTSDRQNCQYGFSRYREIWYGRWGSNRTPIEFSITSMSYTEILNAPFSPCLFLIAIDLAALEIRVAAFCRLATLGTALQFNGFESITTQLTCSVRSMGITSLQRCYEAVRPQLGASVLSALWGLHLHLFPFHRQLDSQVPYESPD